MGQGYAAVVLATGVMPRRVKIPGMEHPKVLSYVDVLRHNKPVSLCAGGCGCLLNVCEGALWRT